MTPGFCCSAAGSLYKPFMDNSLCQVFQAILCTSASLACQFSESLELNDLEVLEIAKGAQAAVNLWPLPQSKPLETTFKQQIKANSAQQPGNHGEHAHASTHVNIPGKHVLGKHCMCCHTCL